MQLLQSATITAKGSIDISLAQSIESKGDIKKATSQNINGKTSIKITFEKTIQAKVNILKSFTNTITAKGAIATYSVVEIIDRVRDQKLVDELTYVKDRAKPISYNKVEVFSVVDERQRISGIPRTRPVVKEITDPSRVIRTKWITAKAKIN